MNTIRKIIVFIKTNIIYAYYKHKYRDVDYFQYKKLVNPRFVTPMGFSSVFYYGNYKAVARLKHSKFNFWTEYLEHGMSFYENMESVPALGYIGRKSIRRVYTYGNKRKKVIETYLKENDFHKEVIAIGPYIKGARHFKPLKELAHLKERLGKLLLVFPMHSVEGADAAYDHDAFMEAIAKAGRLFNRVLICVYWKDIINSPDYIEKYEQQGYTVVCNGHRADPAFLSRQKDLIYLSDMVMTNGLGTYIGYAISMNTPVHYYSQKTSYELINNPFAEFMKEQEMQIAQVKAEFVRLFGNFSFDITSEQISFIESYWGKWN